MLFNLLADLRLLGMFTALGLLRWRFVLGLPGCTGSLGEDYLESLGGTRTKGGIESKLKVDPRTFFFDAIAPAGSAMKARFSGDR